MNYVERLLAAEARVAELEAEVARLRLALANARPFVLVSAARMQNKGIEPVGAALLLAEIDRCLA